MNHAAIAPTPSFINDLASGRVELPTIPRVVARLIAALRNPDVDSRTISEELSRDPVLSAKVLRLAGSSFFGGQRPMTSIDAAVAMVGSQAINKLIMACGVSSAFEDIPGIDLRSFWAEAILVGTASQMIAPRLGADPEAAYICGLLHLTGHLILCQAYPAVAQGIFTGYAVVRGAKLAEIENEAFGIDHPAVGALWLESLAFPKLITDTIRKATQPSTAPDELPQDLTLRAACRLAFASSRKFQAEVAFAALQPKVRSLFASSGKPDVEFIALFDALSRIQPSF